MLNHLYKRLRIRFNCWRGITHEQQFKRCLQRALQPFDNCETLDDIFDAAYAAEVALIETFGFHQGITHTNGGFGRGLGVSPRYGRPHIVASQQIGCSRITVNAAIEKIRAGVWK